MQGKFQVLQDLKHLQDSLIFKVGKVGRQPDRCSERDLHESRKGGGDGSEFRQLRERSRRRLRALHLMQPLQSAPVDHVALQLEDTPVPQVVPLR